VKHYLKHLFSIIFILSLLVACKQSAPDISSTTGVSAVGNAPISSETNVDTSALIEAYKNKKSDIFVEGSGVVKKLLADDNKGSRHQKFLVSISAEQTLLFAHNIDLAPRIDTIQVGDAVTFRGEYVYNPKGGVMHWTHHDPQGGNKVGWIIHNGQKYE
jgi:Protein of unknown function (DUF3465)